MTKERLQRLVAAGDRTAGAALAKELAREVQDQAEIFWWLLGATLKSIEGVEKHSEHVRFVTKDGDRTIFQHEQDCCEDVYLEDVTGNVEDLIGSPILQAECVTSDDESGRYDSATWTFYKFATVKGSVTMRWLGVSNGYYSEYVAVARHLEECCSNSSWGWGCNCDRIMRERLGA
jgi:hypothetical protein